MRNILLALVLLAALARVQSQARGQNTNLSLFEISPCDGPHHQTVSRFKSDIYAIKSDFGNCTGVSGWYGKLPVNKIGLRVSSWITNSSTSVEKAVVFVSRQGDSAVSSWSVPFKPDGFENYFNTVDRTMCPSDISDLSAQSPSGGVVMNVGEDEEDDIFLFYVDVFSSSVDEISYAVQVDVVPQFVLMVGEPVSVMVGAASPQIFYFKFPNDSSNVRIEAEAVDDRCLFISVQKNKCPINDLLESVRSRGIYQTMSKTAYLTVSHNQFDNREFVVVLITTNYSLCHKKDVNDKIIKSQDIGEFSQNVTLVIRNLEPITNFILPIFLPFMVFIVYILLICIYAFLLPRCYFRVCGKGTSGTCYVRWPQSIRHLFRFRRMGRVEVTETETLLASQKNGTGYNALGANDDRKPDVNDDSNNSSSMSSTDPEASIYSIAVDLDESNHTLPRMCKTGYHKLRKQYTVYSWNTFTVGIFYALPAFQLVLSEQQILNTSGDQDKCYYNFKCAHPLGMLSAFNNIWSNVGYVLLGGLFFVIVWYRDGKYRKKRQANREYIDTHGIPQFYGIYYGMSIALILEGFMSSFYHICPTNANFQFDTAFMFIIGGLFLVKIFQKRHPDINVNAFVAFFTFAIVIFVTLIGLYVDVNHPYAIRSAVFLFSLILVFTFLASFYNFHFWPGFKEIKERMKGCGQCPSKKKRFFKLLLVAVVNVVLAVVCIVVHDLLDIATCVLIFFVTNLLIFLLLYVLQKLLYCEKLTVLPLVLIVVIGALWLAAFVFFMGLTTTNWALTPAESRTMNHECFILGFYDYHDVWHFFSASAMFFSFAFLLTLDDGVQHTPRDQLHVF